MVPILVGVNPLEALRAWHALAFVAANVVVPVGHARHAVALEMLGRNVPDAHATQVDVPVFR